MIARTRARLALLILAVGFVAFTALSNVLFAGWRVDLTENGLYSVSDGTREILASIDEPINLYLFFSDEASRELAPLRSYARRVRELLEELELRADGRLRLQVIDPVPFSAAEDQAAAFGLQSVPITVGGEQIYFGLAGSNAYDEVEVIPFFQPDREEFLEYEIARLIQTLVQPARPVVGLLSSIDINGGFDLRAQRSSAPWMVIEQAKQTFELRDLDAELDSIDEDISLLLLVHPAELPERSEYAIDQFVMRGGRVLAFVDPYAESARRGGDPVMGAPASPTASSLPRLFESWGLTMEEGKVLGDQAGALLINAVPGQPPVPHLAFTALGAEASQDIVSQGLEAVNVGAAGVLRQRPGASTRFEPVLQSSRQSGLLDAAQVQLQRDPRQLFEDFVVDDERYTVVARVSGPARSAFDGPLEEGAPYVASSDAINVMVVADVDLLADRMWVQVSDFFGQRLATAWADNGSLVLNALENLAGSDALISIRSRGRYSRPFTVVQDLRAEAEARNLQTADRLERKLAETEQRLAELQQSKEEQNLLVLSPEQEAALEQFQQEKLQIRRQLRDVQHQLNKDIEALGVRLKLLNIVVLPVLLTVLLWLLHRLLQRRTEWSRGQPS
jgi:ABC-type uncharacterized transport system involved in gliding motility auxiliary subunit